MTSTNYTESSTYYKKVNTIKEQIPIALEDFKKSYVLYKQNPTSNTYEEQFQRINDTIKQLLSELMGIKLGVSKDTITINKNLDKINMLISQEKRKNISLKKQLGMIDNEYNSSEELISNYVHIYNIDYLQNFSMLAGIIILGFYLSKTFNKSAIPINPNY